MIGHPRGLVGERFFSPTPDLVQEDDLGSHSLPA